LFNTIKVNVSELITQQAVLNTCA